MEYSLYHKLLRVAALTCTVCLLLVSGLLHPATSAFSQKAVYLTASSIGVTVGIAPNELNVITAKLTEKEHQLSLREAAVLEREISVNVPGGTNEDTQTYILSTLLFVILVLIIINYILDYRRAYSAGQINLRV